MDRETALQTYQDNVSERIKEFQSHIGDYILERAEALEAMVKTAMDLLGEQMKKQGKEYICFMYFSFLKADLINKNFRFMLQGLDMQWYLDEEPAQVYVDAGDLFEPLMELWSDLKDAGEGFGGAVNCYDIQNIIFDQLPYYDTTVSYILRYRLREWETKGILSNVVLSPYWLLKWGQYRDQTEYLIQTDRTEKEEVVWYSELAKAKHKPDKMIFSYWYKGTYEENELKELDLRFITFEKSTIKNIKFQDCNMEGSRFIKCSFTDCTFAGCNLCGADFRGCSFEHTSFDKAELTAATFPERSVPFLSISVEQLQVIRIDREGVSA